MVIHEKSKYNPFNFCQKQCQDEGLYKALQDYAEKSTPETPKPAESNSKEQQVTITVKRGDMLERIARANGTTVQKLKQLNQLQDERIEGEPSLRPCLSQKEEIVQEAPKKTNFSDNGEFYTIKSGDNPWKIAKQFNVRFDELLQLNNLDEEKARKLKAGDKIRVH